MNLKYWDLFIDRFKDTRNQQWQIWHHRLSYLAIDVAALFVNWGTLTEAWPYWQALLVIVITGLVRVMQPHR